MSEEQNLSNSKLDQNISELLGAISDSRQELRIDLDQIEDRCTRKKYLAFYESCKREKF